MRAVIRTLPLVVLVLAAEPSSFSQQALGPVIPIVDREHWLGEIGQGGVASNSTGGFVVAWEPFFFENYQYGAFARIYGPRDQKLGRTFEVSTYTTNYFHTHPDVAMAPDGSFIVVWEEGPIKARRFDATGDPIGEVVDVGGGDGYPAVVGVDHNGGFVVAWSRYTGSAGDYDIFARRFDASDTALGPEFQVNSYTPRNQDNPKIAVNGDGKFVIVWSSNLQVRGQSFDASGNRVGTEFVGAGSYYPTVAMNDSGAFVVAWGNPKVAVQVQRFDSSAQPIGSILSSDLSDGHPALHLDSDGAFQVVGVRPDGVGTWFVSLTPFAPDGTRAGADVRISKDSGPVGPGHVDVSPDAGDFVVTWHEFRSIPSRRGPVYREILDARRVAGRAPAIRFKKAESTFAESVSVPTRDLFAPAAEVDVIRTGDCSGSATVEYATSDGSAVAPGDYLAQSGTLNFAPSETSQTIQLRIVQDGIPEGQEDFKVTLKNPGGAALGEPIATTIHIADDDGSVFYLPEVQQEVSETDDKVVVTVERSGSLLTPASVRIKTVALTASADVDYQSIDEVLSFAPGASSLRVPIKILPDDLIEGPETFSVKLSSATGASIGTQHSAVITIIDGD